MTDPRFIRVEHDDDPERCQGVTAGGQCKIKSIPGGNFCTIHAGRGNAVLEKQKMRNFRLTQWQGRVEEFAENDQVKSLREEIGILRVMLEETVNRCRTSTELLLYSNKISDMISKIEKLVVSCHRLEEKTGMLLDKETALFIASRIVAIISQNITDADRVDKISNEIIEVILGEKKDESQLPE